MGEESPVTGKGGESKIPRGRVSFWVLVGSILVAFTVGFVSGAIVQHRRGLSAKVTQVPKDQMDDVVGKGEATSKGPSKEEIRRLQALEDRVRRNPDDADGWIELGNLNYDLMRPREAILAYEKALALRPGNPDVITDMGTMYRALGQPKKAVELYREAQRIDPNHFHSLYNEGVVLLHDLNDLEGAARAWEGFLKVVPQGEQAERIRGILESLRAQIAVKNKENPNPSGQGGK